MTPPDHDQAPTLLPSGRVETFSDGIIAIAATLLVLELAVPEQGADVLRHLRHELPAIAAFVVSFLTILIYWVNHHALFAVVRTVDRGLLFLNGLLLLLISFISYPTAVLGRALQHGAGERDAALFYGLVLTAGSLSFTAIWVYLRTHPHLLHPWARGVPASALRRGLLGSALYLATTGLALVSAPAALAATLALALYFALPPRRSGRGRAARGTAR